MSGYGPDDRGVPGRVVQAGSLAHPPSYPMGTEGSLLGYNWPRYLVPRLKRRQAVPPLLHTHWRYSENAMNPRGEVRASDRAVGSLPTPAHGRLHRGRKLSDAKDTGVLITCKHSARSANDSVASRRALSLPPSSSSLRPTLLGGQSLIAGSIPDKGGFLSSPQPVDGLVRSTQPHIQ